MPEEKDVQFQSSSVAQAACNLGLWDCGSIGHRSTDHFTVAGASFARCSRVAVSLRRHIKRVVWWSRAGVARYGPIRFRFLVFTVSVLFVGSLSAAQRSAMDSLRRARYDLKETAQELQRTNEALQAESRERKRAEEASRQ